ncbi:diguanylate cyclase [Planosporangium flavigriseum]|uniref:diguanylate cyclase n=1 Tax=Planosporangium flavigriseum TaxID=373681 RepID=UPI001EF28584|nr:diguanylate cyclase [Planosporangium flavigriseum]
MDRGTHPLGRGSDPAELTDFAVEAEIGRSVYTTVHRARRGDRTYALKRLRTVTANDTDVLTSFCREAGLLACVDHPGVVRAHAAGRYEDGPALVTELIDGGSLAAELVKGGLPLDRVKTLAGELAEALVAAHRTGLVHRDIKPQNIMVPPGRPAVLIDFGLAAIGRSPVAEDTAVGTFAYGAPEQTGMLKRPVDARSDLYSLGAVLFECLTGNPPYVAEDVGELLRMHAVAPVPDPRASRPDVDPAFAAVVMRLLAKDPDDRYPSATALLAALGRADGAGSEWPLCGRPAEREALLARWERARNGHGGVAVVRGPAGGGRSRLAAEVAVAAATDETSLVLRTRAVKDEELPLAAVRAAVDAHLARVADLPDERRTEAYARLRRAADVAGTGLIGNLSPAVAAILADRPGPPADGRDDRLFTAVAVFLAELAGQYGSGVLEVDDAQWLDASSRRVLELLAPELSDAPLLVVVTYLDGAEETHLGDAVDTEIVAGPLDQAGTSALVASRLPGATVPPDLVSHVAARTGGLPLASVEYLRQLVDAGLLVPVWGTWRLDEAGLDGLHLSRDLGELVVSRLDGLPAPARDLLVTAAVVGNRFRLEVATAACDLTTDEFAAALDVAVTRRLVEPREDGRYGFIHPSIRDALLDGVPETALRRLHAAVAAGLDDLPADGRDAGHVYAVARHYAQAGADADPAAGCASALAAGRQALVDDVPEDAVAFLEQARTAAEASGHAVTAELLHPLATAYLRAGRWGEALSALEAALAGERDPHRRAELYRTMVELHHTTWSDDRAVAAARQGLAELGHGLPRNKLALIVTTLALALAGTLVARLRIGFGTARGRRREDLANTAALLGSAAYAAAVGLRVKEMAIFALRGLYGVNRLGPCPQYVQVHALLGYLAALLKQRRRAERAFARADRAAQAIGDPAMVAYAEWLRSIAMLFGGFDDGIGWDKAISQHTRWLEPAQFITGLAVAGLRLVLRGYTREAQTAYEQGLRHLPEPTQASGTTFAMLGVMVPAQQGRHAAAAAALASLRAAFPDGAGTPAQWANILTAAASAAVEQGEFGTPFDDLVAEFEGLGLRRSDLMPQHEWFYVYRAHGRLAQLRVAPDGERAARLAVAERAVRDLGRVTTTPLLKVAHQLAAAALEQQRGNAEKAIDLIDRVDRAARTLDAPLVSFEVARIRARAFRQFGLAAEAERQARNAYVLAVRYGWEHRRRQVRVEFGVDDAPSVARFTQVADRSSSSDRNRRLEALQEVSVAAASVLDPQLLAEVALDETLRILGAERALMFLVDDEGDPVPFAGRTAAGNDVDAASGYGSTLVRRVLETREALVVTGTDEGAALGSQSVVAHGLRSIMVAPVQLKGVLHGVVYLDSRVARGVFTEDDVEVLSAITHHVAVSLETARAAQLDVEVRTTRRQQELAETLRASLAELSAILDPAQLLNQLFTTLYGQAGAWAGCLLHGSGQKLTSVAVAGTVDATALGPEVDAAADAAFAALCTADTPTVIAGDDVPTAVRALLGEHPAALVVPLIARDGPVGVVILGGETFDDSAPVICAGLAGQGMSAYDNAVLFSRVQELATTDELTGVPNRRHFYALAGTLVAAARRSGRALGAVMLDIDKFKGINDTYGHATGDDVIREVANRVAASVRDSDVLGRYGGEEFVAVLPDLDGGVDLAERIRAAVAASPVPTRSGPVPVTVSVGLARLGPVDDDLDQLVARADHALYRAKDAGRNRVEEA